MFLKLNDQFNQLNLNRNWSTLFFFIFRLQKEFRTDSLYELMFENVPQLILQIAIFFQQGHLSQEILFSVSTSLLSFTKNSVVIYLELFRRVCTNSLKYMVYWAGLVNSMSQANELLSGSRHRTTNFPNSESWIFTMKFCLLAWSTVGRDTLQFIYWNHATFFNSF